MAHLSETVAHSEPKGWLTLTGQAAQNGPNYSLQGLKCQYIGTDKELHNRKPAKKKKAL